MSLLDPVKVWFNGLCGNEEWLDNHYREKINDAYNAKNFKQTAAYQRNLKRIPQLIRSIRISTALGILPAMDLAQGLYSMATKKHDH